MLDPKPGWETCIYVARRWRGAGVTQQKIFHGGKFPQRLSDGYCDNDEDECHGQCPQHIDPVSPDPDPRDHAGLGRQPMAQHNTIIGWTQIRCDWVVCRWNWRDWLHLITHLGSTCVVAIAQKLNSSPTGATVRSCAAPRLCAWRCGQSCRF